MRRHCITSWAGPLKDIFIMIAARMIDDRKFILQSNLILYNVAHKFKSI